MNNTEKHGYERLRSLRLNVNEELLFVYSVSSQTSKVCLRRYLIVKYFSLLQEDIM